MSTETHRPAAVVVLAAGQGTRMKSRLPKVLHPVGGRPMVGHAIAAARELDPAELAVVVRHERDLVAATIAELDPAARVVDQDEVPGTGRAVECAMEALGEIDGAVVVLAGDVPLLDGGTLAQMLATHHAQGDAVTILSTQVPDATGYGRIVRGADGAVEAIVEHKDATPAQLEVREINTSTYVFDAATLRRGLASLDRANAQGEVYLTDVIAFARKEGGGVRAVMTDDTMSVEGVNDRVQLATLGAELNRRTLEHWMREGVTVVDPGTTWVDVDVELAPDVTLLPGVQLHGATTVGEGATIGPDTTLRDTEVHDGATVVRTHAELAVIGAGAKVGPYSYLRPGTVLGPKGKIGGFVETKNARIGEGAKVPHLSYVGDAEIGEHTNIGAASVTVNYDGVHKHRTVIGAHARTGADNMFVAPVTVGDGAYTAAGSVIVKDVPPGALGVGRSEQRNIEGWVARRRPGTAAAEAAAAADPGATDHSTTSGVGHPDQERKAH
ncbi:bifunctional UDP-N-acetylglucosamine diphosphorylase/glucosamine-1-phosphate N-acetyltransferase GlmU [Myceligenerans indicum]|uniref:Bifunctional protein GlmU n=1 Tax=Myceligenerans indicum TaxID=2593663 RepID=A0ABS1LH71_9MICO|nr:bifunctional UDP-N-acetylglucosamine diphosphorylase/glucosamine-1-phosphate N-acetyltransferase GlmU [Myceligenerans indicum]MBL0885567.1 bifunctional UDP-N-acetylglucosamine diphosphorylase/glucosamine-1-phosphate N-acetyltransferase GlmU [Myceligenerans indicum]